MIRHALRGKARLMAQCCVCSRRGYGFVKFGDESEQKKALEEFQNASGLGGKPIRISIAVNKRYVTSLKSSQRSSLKLPFLVGKCKWLGNCQALFTDMLTCRLLSCLCTCDDNHSR